MRLFCRRLSTKLGPVFTHELTSSEAGVLTKGEKAEISKLLFFTESSYAKPPSMTKNAKKDYLDKKLPIVQKIFGEDPGNPGYLKYTLPKDLPNPYLDAHLRRVVDPETGKQEYRGVRRLSVTKLLTKRWCELREAYDIYAKIPIYAHEQVLEGTAEHQKLEDETHPIPEEWHEFVNEFELVIPQDHFHELVSSWFGSTVKLLNLFVNGRSREVLCHGFVNMNSCEPVEGPVKAEDDVLVSGVIDHLFLRRKTSKSRVPFALGDSIIKGPTIDLSVMLEELSRSGESLESNYEVVVSDVKTRSIRKLPAQNSVLRSTKLQVMYYRYFMETLGANPHLTYEKLLINAQRRGFDVDAPVDPAKVISIMAAETLVISDMRRLRDGEDLGFKPYDDFYSKEAAIEEYDLSNYLHLITDVRVIEQFEEFFTQWSRPVTLRYFAARLAQIYGQVAPLLSNSLLVEYYCRGDNFHNVEFEYNVDLLKAECSESAKFWFGHREIQPIKPSVKNILTHCKRCDYEDVCSWSRQASDNCRNLGKDLASLADQTKVNL